MKRRAARVLLVGWDGADWKMINRLVDAGLMPNMKRFVDEGVMGNVASLQPMLSPILWTSIATGKHADKHGVLGFAEPDGATGKVRPVTSTSRRCKALWNILSENGLKAGVINWYASHPAEPIDGFVVTDRYPRPSAPPDQEWPLPSGSIHPQELADDLAAMRVHPAHTTAEQIAPFIIKLSELDPAKDKPLQELRGLLAHCATVHAATTYLMQERDWDFFGIYYDAIDRFAHSFMEYHPPKMEHVSEEDFQHYRDVMDTCYKFHDMMLGRLMNIAGDDTTVIIVSDHGFHCDDLRPKGTSGIKDGQPVAWHRPYGVIAFWGPGLKKDKRVYGASLLDVTPTVLTMLGLPVADDMDGQSLTQIFEDGPFDVPRIESYESPDDEQASDSPEDDPWIAQQMLDQLKQLGYLGDDDADGVVVDRLRNLGQVYLATGRPKLAMEQFREACERKPDDKGSKMMIAWCLLDLGRLEECEAMVNEVLTEDEDTPRARLYLGMIALRRGDTDAALEHLQAVYEAEPSAPGLHFQLGQVYLRRQMWPEAEDAFNRALEHDPENAEALDGIGVTHRVQGRLQAAVNAHMQSIALLHYRPQTHINLGLSLMQLGRVRWAARAFKVAIEMNPNNPVPHRCLAEIHERAMKDPEKASEHRRRAQELRAAMSRGADDKASDR